MIWRKPTCALFALLSAASLSGCLNDAIYRFDTAPTAPPQGIRFVDTSLGLGIGGMIEVDRATDESGFSEYAIHWATGGVQAGDENNMLENGQYNFVALISTQRDVIEWELPVNTPIPPGVDGFIVKSYNALGESPTGAVVYIDNVINGPRTANTRAQNLIFVDYDHDIDISGPAIITAALDESDIEFYRIRYADQNGCPISGEPLVTLNATGAETLQANIASPQTQTDGKLLAPPANATNLLVVSGNQYGEHTEENCANYRRLSTAWNSINFSIPARYSASKVNVSDLDVGINLNISVTVQPAINELDIRHYSVYVKSFSTGQCTFLGQIAKGGGSLSYQMNYTTWRNLLPANSDSAMVFAISDGESCNNYPYNFANLNENSGKWYQIYNMDPAGIKEITDAFYLFPRIFDKSILSPDTYSSCIEADGDSLKLATCDPYKGGQRFSVVNANQTNKNFHYIKALSNNKCFYRNDLGTEEAWKLTDCNNSEEQRMELKSTNNNFNDKKIAVANVVAGITNWSCATSHNTRTDIFGTWGNCNVGVGIFWQFWEGGYPSRTAQFEDKS